MLERGEDSQEGGDGMPVDDFFVGDGDVPNESITEYCRPHD